MYKFPGRRKESKKGRSYRLINQMIRWWKGIWNQSENRLREELVDPAGMVFFSFAPAGFPKVFNEMPGDY
jgi:hypothetical protein